MNNIAQNPAPITSKLLFTEAAARKVMGLIDEEGDSTLNLRVYITGGGCSGFQYGFTFDPTINGDDLVLEKTLKKAGDKDEGGEGAGPRIIKLLVDPMSLQYLLGAEIDYREDVNGSQFVIRNPNAKTTCGCGSSFSA